MDRGCDVLVIAGLNNCKDENDVDILEHIKKFKQLVMKQSDKHHPEDPSTFAVSTLLYPGKFCWFPDDGPPPTENYINKLDMMRTLNNKIIAFNNETMKEQMALYRKMMGDDWEVAGMISKAPRFHKYGVRKQTVSKGKRKVGVTTHWWGWWRSSEPKKDSLHLADKHRGRMGEAVSNYYSFYLMNYF